MQIPLALTSILFAGALALAQVGQPATGSSSEEPRLSLGWDAEGRVATLSLEAAVPGEQVAFTARIAGRTRVLGVVPADGRGRARLRLAPAELPLRPVVIQAVTTSMTTPQQSGAAQRTAQGERSATLYPSFSDSFDGTELGAPWSLHNIGLIQYSLSGGALHMRPLPGTPIWFNDGEGALIHRYVTGDFTATTRMRVESELTPGQPPPPQFRLGGLLARDPTGGPGTRNSVHVALGSGFSGAPIAVEDKTTVDSSSTFFMNPLADSTGHLRLRRAGSLFSLYHRPLAAGSAWTLVRAIDRPDLPETLQVGLMTYSQPSPPDLETHVEHVRIELE